MASHGRDDADAKCFFRKMFDVKSYHPEVPVMGKRAIILIDYLPSTIRATAQTEELKKNSVLTFIHLLKSATVKSIFFSNTSNGEVRSLLF